MSFHKRSAKTVRCLLFSVLSRVTVVIIFFCLNFFFEPMFLVFLTAIIGFCFILSVGFIDDNKTAPAINELMFEKLKSSVCCV